MRYVTYFFKLVVYYILRLVVLLIKILVIFHIAPNFFKSIIASYSIGEGSQAYEEKRYNDAIKILKPISDYQIKDVYVGDAQYILGVIYYYGLGIEKDIDTAISYFKKSSIQNNNDAKKIS